MEVLLNAILSVNAAFVFVMGLSPVDVVGRRGFPPRLQWLQSQTFEDLSREHDEVRDAIRLRGKLVLAN